MFISSSSADPESLEPLQFTERPSSPEPLRKLQPQDKLLSYTFQWRLCDPAFCPPPLTLSIPGVQLKHRPAPDKKKHSCL